MNKLVKTVISTCDDCPFCDAFSVDCVAYARCFKSHEYLPAHGKAGTEIMYMPFPDWCPLPDTDLEVTD